VAYITEQLEYALTSWHAIARIDDDDDPVWILPFRRAAYMFVQNAEGWQSFCAEMNVDPDTLVRENYHGTILELCLENMHKIAPSAAEVEGQLEANVGRNVKLVTADILQKHRRNQMAELRGFEWLRK
jgi:hypothetical protein